jgi:hypothetical protein
MPMKWTIVLLMPLFFLGCGDNTNTPLAGDVASISVSPQGSDLYATQKLQMTATAHYTQGVPDSNVTVNITWESSDTGMAFFSPTDITANKIGLLTAGTKGGDVNITGFYDQFADSAIVHMHALESMDLNTSDANLSDVHQEQTLHLRAWGTFDDNTTLDITDSVLWVLGNAGDSNATLDQNGTLYTGDANSTLDVNVTRDDVNASLQINVIVP